MPLKTQVGIVGAGPAGLFQVFELGLLGIKAHILDTLKAPGGQCTELYPDKPIYDIPALPICGAQELVDRLIDRASEPVRVLSTSKVFRAAQDLCWGGMIEIERKGGGGEARRNVAK